MLKKTISIILLISIYLFTCNKIYIEYKLPKNKQINKNTPVEKIISKITSQEIKLIPSKDESIGQIKIEKISLKQKLYPISSSLNNIEKNVTILDYSEEPSIKNSIMFIAAHSGTGHLAYFKNLNKLQKNDLIELTYYNIKYIYQVKDIWEVKKTGSISINKENNTQLILTTCSPTKDNYQLIINAIQIKKES